MQQAGYDVQETVSASKKLGETQAKALVAQASTVVVMKGKKVQMFSPAKPTAELITSMLGSTGNLRAPLLKRGKTLLVGFNEEVYADRLK